MLQGWSSSFKEKAKALGRHLLFIPSKVLQVACKSSTALILEPLEKGASK